MIKNHLKIAFRQLVKNKVLSGINILSLSIGLTGALVCYLILQHQFSFDHFHSNAENIHRIVQHTHRNGSTAHWSTICYPLPAALRADFPDIKATQTAGPFNRIFSVENAIGDIIRFEEDQVLFADEHYLSFFDFQDYYPKDQDIWLAGDRSTAFDDPYAVVITEAIAERYFGQSALKGQEIVGKTMYLDNDNALTVTGVLRNPPNNTNLNFDLLLPYELFRMNDPYRSSNWAGNYNGSAFVQLPDNVQAATFEETLNTWKKNYLKAEDFDRIEYRLQALSDIHLNNLYASTPGSYVVNQKLLWGLGAMAVFLLLIGCINFINLSTARMTRRAKEVSVNKVLGSSKSQLRRQFLSETILLSSLALGISIFSTHLIVNWFNHSFNLVDIHLAISPDTYLFGFGITAITALLAGSYPAIVLSNLSPMQGLKPQNFSFSISGFGLRQSLIVLQFSIVFILLIGMLLARNQMKLFLEEDMGFAQESIVSINIPGGNREALESFRTQILAHPNIEEMSYGSGIPMTNDFAYGTDVRFPHESEDKRRSAEMKVVDLHYQNLYELKMLAGKWLGRSNVQDAFNGFVVNEALVETMGMTVEEAIGQQLVINEGQAPIIGVVEDFNNNPLKEAVAPCLLFYWVTGFFHEAGLKISAPSDLASTLAFVKDTWHTNFPEAIFDYQFVDESLANYYQLESFIYQTVRIFSIIAILIGCIGLYGLMTFITTTRTKEIGIRKVLGASVTGIVALLSKDFIKLVVLAFAIATPVAYYFMNQWLQNFVYRIEIQWWVFAIAGISAIGIAFLTVSFQSVKAAIANLIEALKNE